VKLGGNKILNGVNLHVNCHELLAIVGPNGAGKTTLLRAILREIPFSGTMKFQIRSRECSKPRIGYVPQKLGFAPDTPMTVMDLIGASVSTRPVWMGFDSSFIGDAERMLAKVSADHLLKKRLSDLSGGELQRVLLALAMTPVPDILLLDEPASGVDAEGLSLFYRILDELRGQHDISILMVTHDLLGVAALADRMILLNSSIIADGSPSEVFSDLKLIETFGRSLWNISKFPDTRSIEGGLK